MFGLKPRNETRAIDSSSFGPAWSFMTGGESWSGTTVTQDTAMQQLAVYGCVKFICDGISTLPLDEFRRNPDGTKTEIDPKTAWLERPTPELDRVAWTTQVLTSLLLDGNAYLHVRRFSESDVQVMPLSPQMVQVRRENGVKTFWVNGVSAANMEIHHIPGLMLPGSSVGLSPVEMARQTIGGGMAAEEFAARQLGQGMSMAGVIEHPSNLPPEGPSSPREMARMFARLHGGKNKAGLPAVLEGGAKWHPTGITNEQAQFLQTRQFTAAQIAAMMFLIDPTEFGMSMDKGSSITYGNLEQRNSRKVTVTYLPWIIRLERCITNILSGNVPGSPRYVKLNVSGLMRGDLKTRYESYKIGEDTGFLLTDEIRAFEELEPLPPTPPAPPDLLGQIEAVGQLIRAGFDPAAALQAVGLPPIPHTGLHPVTVTEGA